MHPAGPLARIDGYAMIIEPTPTNPRSRIGRAARMLGLALPVLLLAAVVGGGVLGRSAAPASPEPSPAQTAAAAAAPDRSATPEIEAVDGGGERALPEVIGNLAVRTVTEALAIRDDSGPDLVVAVAGHLGMLRPAEGCTDPVAGPLGPLCERQGVLTEEPWVTTGGGAFSTLGVHLHPRFPVGVRVPDEAGRSTTQAGGPPLVVVLGRFEAGGDDCQPAGFRCGRTFVADRVAWVDGAPTSSQLVIDAGINRTPGEWMLRHQGLAEVAAIGWSGTILVAALLHPRTVELVDPVAARALAAAPPPEGLVWYVRGLETGYDPIRYPLGQARPRLSWAILDDITGAVVARSSVAQPSP